MPDDKTRIEDSQEESASRVRSALPVVLLLTLAAAAVRLPDLFSTPIDLDEGYTLLTARRGLVDPILFGPCDRNPLLSHLPHALWAVLGSNAKESLELVSFLSGLAVIPVIFLIGAELFSRRTGFLAAAGVAFSTFHSFYSQYIRVYSAAVLVLAVSLLYFVRWQSSRKRADGAIALAAALLAINLHYYAALSVGAALLFLAASALKEPALRRPAVLAGLTIFIGTVPTIVWQARVLAELNEPTWMAAPGLKTFASIWFHLSSRSIPLMILYLSLMLAAALRLIRQPENRGPLLLLFSAIAVPLAVPLLFSLSHGSVFHLRYFIFVSVPFILIAAEGLVRLPSARLQAAVLLGLLLSSAFAVKRELEERAAAGPLRVSPLALLDLKPAPQSGEPLIFTSKCGYISAASGGLLTAPAYLLKSEDDSWVLKCIAGAGLEIDRNFLGRFENFVIINQGCPPAPSKVELCRPDAFSAYGFTGLKVWGGGAACEFGRSPAGAPL